MMCTMDSSFFSQQMPYCLLTLLVYMALAHRFQLFPALFRRTLKVSNIRQTVVGLSLECGALC